MNFHLSSGAEASADSHSSCHNFKLSLHFLFSAIIFHTSVKCKNMQYSDSFSFKFPVFLLRQIENVHKNRWTETHLLIFNIFCLTSTFNLFLHISISSAPHPDENSLLVQFVRQLIYIIGHRVHAHISSPLYSSSLGLIKVSQTAISVGSPGQTKADRSITLSTCSLTLN